MGAKASPITTISASDLISNGGQYQLINGKKATRVRINNSLDTEGGAPLVVYVVSAAQVDSGEFEIIGGEPIDVASVSNRGRASSKYAMAVFNES